MAGVRVAGRWLASAFCVGMALPVLAEPVKLEGVQLQQAIQRLAQMSGLQVQGIEHLTGEQRISIEGEPKELLNSLLGGSGASWDIQNGVLRIYPVAPGRRTDDVVQLPQTVVLGQVEPSGLMVLDRNMLASMPAGNGDLTSALKIHPNVQFDNAQLSSKTPGEIAPANISINGAHFYQNAFVVDGIGFNNDIDPAHDNTALLDSAPGRSQGLALDIDLLENIQVYDSNVPVSFGGFTGGVVEANTRAPSKAFSGKVSIQTSRDSWTRYHIDKRDRENFENSGNANMQPKFTKWTRRANLEGHVTDNFGLMASVSQKRSTIPLSFYSANNVAQMGYQEEKQKRKIDNYFLKSVWSINDRLVLESSVTHAPEVNYYFASNIMNSGVNLKSGGQQYAMKLKWDADWARVEQNLAYSVLEQSRDSDNDDYYTWRKSTAKDWGIGSSATTNSLEGGYGDIEQEQKTLQYKLDINLNPWVTGAVTHNISTGLDASWSKVSYERLTEANVYVSPASTNTCVRVDGTTVGACLMSPTINGWNGQYMTSRTRYVQGGFNFTTRELAAYVQNDMRMGNLKLRPGVRIDNDNYMGKTTIAPRLAMEYDLMGNQRTVFSAGANRYYGRSIYAWRLQDGRNRLRFTDRRTAASGGINAEWTQTAHAANNSTFNQLDVPYDDEWMLGFKQQFAGLEFAFKYVNRTGKDQVVKVRGTTLGQPSNNPDLLSSTYTTYTNAGRSRNDIYTLTVQPLRPLDFAGTQTSALLALDWSKSKASSPIYSDTGDTYFDDDYIQYKGRFIHYADRPADNYHRPWTARLNTTTKIESINLTVDNFVRYRSGYAKAGNTGKKVEYNGQLVNVWDELEYKAVVTWDMRLGWELPVAKNQAAFVNLDIFNVLDKQVVSAASTTNAETAVPTYEVGRQFWLEVGYRF